MPCSSRKDIAAASKMVSLYIPSLFSAAGNVLLKRSAVSARPEVSPPRARKGQGVFTVIFCPKFLVCGFIGG